MLVMWQVYLAILLSCLLLIYNILKIRDIKRMEEGGDIGIEVIATIIISVICIFYGIVLMIKQLTYE